MKTQEEANWRVSREEEDPLVGSARREMVVVLVFAVVFALWSVGFCAAFGYDKPADGATIRLVMGMPWWVFWGVIVPWGVASLFTFWFAIFFMKDHDLSRDVQGDATPVEGGDKP